MKERSSPPVAQKHPETCEAHSQTWIDNYAWLRAKKWQQAIKDPDTLPVPVKTYLQRENEYFKEVMADTEELQQKLVSEMRNRILENDDSLPYKDGQYEYSYRYTAGAEHPVYHRRLIGGSQDEITIDINKEAQGHEYFDYDLVEHSPDHKLLLWSRDTSGAEFYQALIRNLQTGTDSNYSLEDVDSAVWANSNTLFYAKIDKNHRAKKIYRHTIGTDPATDTLVYEETDSRFYCSVYLSSSRAFVFIYTGMNDQNEIWLIPTDSVTSAPTLIEPRTEGLEYEVEHQNERFLIITNADEAADFKIVEAPADSPSRHHWKDLIPHKPGSRLDTLEVYQDWTMWLAVENALPKIYYANNTGKIKSIAFDEEAYSLSLTIGWEYKANTFRFTYSSPATAEQTFEYNLLTTGRKLLKEQVIPSGHDNSQYITRRITAISHDGAEVPVTLLYQKNTVIDSTAPCLIYGYGAYGSSTPACFSSDRLSLVDRGFIYAIAHVRGGQEKGRAWYEDAKLEKKVNTFYDFIAVAETLAKDGYTTARNTVIEGGSAGGLLIGAVLNMRPELFGGAIADVPFVDVLNTMLDDSLPSTPGEWSQWGNPIESIEAFNDIKSYSPYDNVSAQNYPPILVTAGVSDPRVTYWEPAKWVAKLRDTKTDDNTLLLKTNMTSGHFGQTGRFAELEDAALTYAFAISVVGAESCELRPCCS